MTTKETLIIDTSRLIKKFLSRHYSPYQWCIAGGFIRDHLLGREPTDVDIYIKAPCNHSDILLANAEFGHGEWETSLAYEYSAHIRNKSINAIYTNKDVHIDLIFIEWPGTFDEYVKEHFDVHISKVLWSPTMGLHVSENAFSDMKTKTLHFSRGASQYYINKMRKKFPNYDYIVYL